MGFKYKHCNAVTRTQWNRFKINETILTQIRFINRLMFTLSAMSAYQKFFDLETDHWRDTAFLYGIGMVYYHYNAYRW